MLSIEARRGLDVVLTVPFLAAFLSPKSGYSHGLRLQDELSPGFNLLIGNRVSRFVVRAPYLLYDTCIYLPEL
jgi:hypothetical protein